MCLLADSLPILRAMIGDTIVPPAPPAVTDAELVELVKASVMMHGVSCTSVALVDNAWRFSPCPPNADTLAYILQGAASIRLGAESPVSYRTRAISVTQHPQGLADMRRYSETLMVDIESRGNVCNPDGAVAGGLISVTLDLIAQSYPFITECCGEITAKEIVTGIAPAAPEYAPQLVHHRVPCTAGLDQIAVTPPTGKTLDAYLPGSASLEWIGTGSPYPLGTTGSHVLDQTNGQVIIHLLAQPATTGDYMLVTSWR